MAYSLIPRSSLSAALSAVLLLAPIVPSLAQDSRRVTPSTAGALDSAQVHHRQLFSATDGEIGAGFAIATVALLPFDARIAKQLQRPALQGRSALDHGAKGVEMIARPGVFVGSGAAYLIGRLAHRPSLADAGLHVGEAALVGAVATDVLKFLAGRARPFATGDSSAHDFALGRGITKGEKYSSFPSGHTGVAFAAAAALTSETAHWHPRAVRLVAPITYGWATLVGLGRMYHDQHWASDVVLGAGVGTLSGLAIVRRQHSPPQNWLDRTLLGANVVPAPDGLAIVWSRLLRFRNR